MQIIIMQKLGWRRIFYGLQIPMKLFQCAVSAVNLGWQPRTEMIKFKIRFGGGSIVARVVFKHTKSFFYPNYNI